MDNARREPLREEQVEKARRRFLKFTTGALSGLIGLTIGIPIVGILIGPVFRKRRPIWAKVVELERLPVGRPVKLTFATQTQSAYIRETVLRNVWAVKRSPSEVTVFSPICPHLGCGYNWNAQTNRFECPCHGSLFSMEGQVLSGPAPRPLDTLQVKVEKGELLVEWEMFRIGISEKVSA